MNLIKDHIAYLKDNPKGYWFKRKLYGWGWTPARPQGWVTIILYIVGVIYFAVQADYVTPNTLPCREDFVPIIILTIVLLFLCYVKGEKPKWQWGLPSEDDK
jgi:hypothetical protein